MSKDSLIYLIEDDILKLNSFLKEFDFTISLEQFEKINQEQFEQFKEIIKISLYFVEINQSNTRKIIHLLKILDIDNISFVLNSIELIINATELFLF